MQEELNEALVASNGVKSNLQAKEKSMDLLSNEKKDCLERLRKV